MKLNRNTKVESLQVSPPDAKPMLPAVPSSVVYNEDCVQALKRFPDKYFDLAVVDPPYGLDLANIFEKVCIIKIRLYICIVKQLKNKQNDTRTNDTSSNE